MRVLLTGVTGLRNRGVEALVASIAEGWARRLPESRLIAASGSADYDNARRIAPNLEFVEDSFRAEVAAWRRNASRVKWALRGQVRPVHRLLANIDLVVATGGDVFGSEYGAESLRKHLRPLELALRAGIPVVMLAQSIGPFREASHAEAWRRVAVRAELITFREQRSLDYVVHDLGLEKKRLELTADPGLLLRPDPKRAQSMRIGSARRAVAVSVSEGICSFSGADYARHLEVWSTLLQKMLDEWNVDVVLIPHVQEPYSDDRIIATNLWRRFQFSDRVGLEAADLTAAEYKGIVSACEMVIAERMHVAVAGLSTGVCTAAIGYSVKARGIVEAIAGKEWCDEGCVIPIDRLHDVDSAWASLSRVWQNREAIAARLRSAMPGVCRMAERNFELIAERFGAAPPRSARESGRVDGVTRLGSDAAAKADVGRVR